MSTELTPAALEAVRSLVRLVMQRERRTGQGQPSGLDPLPADIQRQLAAVPRGALLASIRRHRLEGLLHADPVTALLLPDLAPTIQALARREVMAALALASLTREIAVRFEQAGIPMLVIKGIPLALQTTGSLTSRGRGDLDLLVDPRHLQDAVSLLETAGFSRSRGQFPRDLNSVWGRYSRWAGYELSLSRPGAGGRQWIDLHWALSNVRGPLPSVQQAWRCRQQLDLNGQAVMTLSPIHAFQHACAHAAKDRWMCLRHLIDIDRLARLNNARDLKSVRHQPTVRWSCAVTNAVTGGVPEGVTRMGRSSSRGRGHDSTTARLMIKAARAQVLPWRSQGPGPWTPRRWATTVWDQMTSSRDPRDWLRIMLYFTVLPAALTDPDTGEDHGLFGFMQARIHRFQQRMNERSSSQDAANTLARTDASRPEVEQAEVS